MKFIYYAIASEVIVKCSNNILKYSLENYNFAQRPNNIGYITSNGQATGCSIYPYNVVFYSNQTKTPGFPSYHTQMITFVTTLLIYDETLTLSYISIGIQIILIIIVLHL
jgi:hypothetical protein